MAQQGHGGRKAREGTVVSDRMDKTVVVAVGSSMRSRIYKKIVRRVRRFMAHDETNDAKLGDRVLIVESRPYSRRKRWQLSQVLVRADRPEIAAEEIDLGLLGEVKAEEEGEAAATVEAAIGRRLSLIVGTEKELLGTGLGAWPGSYARTSLGGVMSLIVNLGT